MNNFFFSNPTKVVFGKGTISKLSELVSKSARVLLLFGNGSIRENGIYDAVFRALGDRYILPYGGIRSNPTHEQCLEVVRELPGNRISFVLGVGGGSVIDAAKYVAVAARLPEPRSAWDIIEKKLPIADALPIGVVPTIQASGSEMNCYAVISNSLKRQKRSLKSEEVFPQFAILDPEVTKSLTRTQIVHGIVDSYSHVIEQYLTTDELSPLQDRFSEAILSTLLEIGPSLANGAFDYNERASFMWATTCALNGFIACGVAQDWSSHWIGHELTAEFGIAHADSIAIVMPGVMEYMKREKRSKLVKYARRVFGSVGLDEDNLVKEAIALTERFFLDMRQPVRLGDFGLGEAAIDTVSKKVGSYEFKIGEKRNIGEADVRKILLLRT